MNKISEEEMLESLTRSGYLLESEITKTLIDLGLFVESNISSLDPLTEKSREIDLIAEFDHMYDMKNRSKDRTVAYARLIFEIKNNLAPLVLMTKYQDSPNSAIYQGLKVGETIPSFMKNQNFDGFYDVLFLETEKDLYTQYCSFSKKSSKDELMAHHPENVYSSLLKITHYCEECAESWNSDDGPKDDYIRNFLYLPVILINEGLYEHEITDDKKNNLKKVECSWLVFNYHYKGEPKTSIVYIITKAGLTPFLQEIRKAEQKVESSMLNAKTKALSK